MDCAQALPQDLGEWRPSVEFALGPYGSAKDLSEISALDFSRSVERDIGAFCRQGYGALLAKLAEGIPVQFEFAGDARSTPARAARGSRRRRRNGPLHGPLRHRHGVDQRDRLGRASSSIAGCPSASSMRAGKLKLGSFDHIALELPGNPLGLQRDDLVFEKASGPRTAALLANVSGTPLAVVEVGGRFGRELSAQGDKAMVDFAVEWLTGLFGGDIKRAVRRTQSTHWDADPWTLGAFSTAAPGAPGRAPHPDGADPRPRLSRRRGDARDHVGHGRRRLGIRRARGRRGAAPARRPAGPAPVEDRWRRRRPPAAVRVGAAEASPRHPRHPRRQQRARCGPRSNVRRSPTRAGRAAGAASDGLPAEGLDRLVERQGQRLRAASRSAAPGERRRWSAR